MFEMTGRFYVSSQTLQSLLLLMLLLLLSLLLLLFNTLGSKDPEG